MQIDPDIGLQETDVRACLEILNENCGRDKVTDLGVAEAYSDHQRLDARSLALHGLIARKILADPALITQARATLMRWRAQAPEPMAPYLEWERILEGTPEEIAAFLTSTTETATRLRQSTPFTGSLTPEERSLFFSHDLKERPPE